MMMQDKVDVEIRLSLLDLLQDLIPSININDQSKANYVLYYFEFFFNNVVMEEASSMIGNKGTFFKGFTGLSTISRKHTILMIAIVMP